jgi:hypothetical protein
MEAIVVHRWGETSATRLRSDAVDRLRCGGAQRPNGVRAYREGA